MTNLAIPTVAQYLDTNIEVGLNDAALAADQAWRKDETLDLSAGSAAPSAALAQRTMLFRLSGVATSGRTVTFPAVAKPFLVYLPASATNTVDIIKGSTTLTHPIGAMRWYYSGAGANDLWSPTIAGGGIQSVQNRDFVGCLLGIDATGWYQVTGKTYTTLNWYQKIVDTHGFHAVSPNPSRITMPAGVTRANFTVGFASTSSMANEINYLILLKNGVFEAILTQKVQNAGPCVCFESGPKAVTAGDYFEFQVYMDRVGTFNLWEDVCFFQMQVLGGALFEGAYNAVPIDVKMPFFAGTPATTTTIYKRMMTAGGTFPANFAGSVAHVATNPSLATTFDIKKNGSIIGTVAFSTAGAVTFATSGGTAQTFAAGDRIEIVTQASVNGIGNIAIWLKGFA